MPCVMCQHDLSCVWATCVESATDVIKTSVYEHSLEVGFTRQIKHGGTLGELDGTQRQVMWCCVQAQAQGVEAYMQDEGGLGWLRRVSSRGVPNVL